MTPHTQRIFDDKHGDCFAACIASILDLPLDAVPNFRSIQANSETYDMVRGADEWLRENYGLRFITIEMYEPKGRPKCDIPILNRLFFKNSDELVILSGESPRKNADGSTKYHCVVAKADCWGFEIVHDPHPDRTGIVGQPYGVKWIVPVPKAAEVSA